MNKVNTSALGVGVGIFAAWQLANSGKNNEGNMRCALRSDNMESGVSQNINSMSEMTTPEAITPGILLDEFVSRKYQISFKYPRAWRKNPRYEDKYEGETGYFEVGDFESDNENIDEAVQEQVDEDYKPYGENPTIRRFVVDGQPARVIYPSEDQPDFFKDRDAAIVVQYPQPITVDGDTYRYVVIWATPQYIPLIISTFKFVNA